MSQVHSKNTKPEILVRRIIFNEGYRYRLHNKNLPGKPDIVFKRLKKVIFINGCFWHHHKNCKYAGIPKSKKKFWIDKFDKNMERDKKNQKELKKLGWQYLIIWQCELKNLTKLSLKIFKFLGD